MPDEPFELPPDLMRQIPLFAEIAKVLSWTGGPVNWDLARQVAVALAAGEEAMHDVARADTTELEESVRLAELWLAEGPGLPSPPRVAAVRALTPARWAEQATSLREIVDPLAAKVAAAVNEQSSSIAPEGEAAMLVPVLQQMAPVFLGIQAGVAVGTLATTVMGSYDLPVPLADEGRIDIVLPSVDAFAASYGLDRRETRLWIALHQTAHRIEFEALSGVSAHFFALFHNYVAALDVDLSGAFERLQSLDITSPDRLREAMEEQGFFGLLDSPGTLQALERVQRFLAMVEAFADRAVEAASVRLATGTRIAEAMARRRGDPSPGEKVFQKFVGLEIVPDHVRQADLFCKGVLAASSWQALLAMWDDPENLPTEDELSEPASWLARVGG